MNLLILSHTYFNSLNNTLFCAGVEGGQVTLISGEGKLVPGKGPVRTVVTAVLTRVGSSYSVGVLVQANYGGRSGLTIAGVP